MTPLDFKGFLLVHTTNAMQGYDEYEYFRVTSPSEYVAVVEINRPEKLNAFIEV